MTDDAWIQRSLARLEALEQQKAQLEARGQTAGMSQLETEIRTLYAALEAAAEDSGEFEDDEEPTVLRDAVDAPAQPSSPASEPVHDPFAVMPSSVQHVPASPFAAAPPAAVIPPAAAAPGYEANDEAASFDDLSMLDDDDDFVPGKSKIPLVVGALVIAAVAVGGWYALGRSKTEAPPAAAPTDVKVITAVEVGEDTQEPKAAQGASAERTPGHDIRETSASRRRSSPSPSRPSAEDDEYVEVPTERGRRDRVEVSSDSKDPLGGLK